MSVALNVRPVIFLRCGKYLVAECYNKWEIGSNKELLAFFLIQLTRRMKRKENSYCLLRSTLGVIREYLNILNQIDQST